MTFSTRLKVRYAEIDGQKVVFNSRYLEYADVAAGDYWDWTGIAALPEWQGLEFHVRRAEIDFLKPFVYGDEIEIRVRTDKVGRTSMTQRFEMLHAETGALHNVIDMVIVNVDLPTGVPAPIPNAVRDYMTSLPT